MIGPYLIEIDEVEIQRLSLDELDARMREAISGLPFVPFKPLRQEEKEFPKDHMDLLRIIATKWFLGEAELRTEMGNISTELLKKLKLDLYDMGAITESENVGVGKMKPKLVCCVTPKGAELLGMDYPKASPPGKGGLLHKFLQHTLARALPNSVVEHNADVVQYTNDESIAYEIELSDENLCRNIERDIALFSRVVIVARNEKECKALKAKAEDYFQAYTLNDVEFKTISEVLKNG